MKKLPGYLVLLMLLNGCMLMGPDYQRPDIDSPSKWRFEETQTQKIVNLAWWKEMQDPVLNDLIHTALRENQDIKIATARIEEFLGQMAITRSGLFPRVDGGAAGGREKVTSSGRTPLPDSVSDTDNFYQAGLSASWEIDLWGRIRRENEAARANLISSEEGRRSIILTLVSVVSGSYVSLRNLDRQLEISQRTVQSRADSLRLFQMRFQGGIVSELELSQIRSEYESALATIPSTQKLIAQQEHALSILLGHNPGAVLRGKTIDELVLPAIPAGLPSDLLERRPDIRQAEQYLVAANALIGAAKTLYFPSISLTGAFGFSSVYLSDLFTGSARTWNFTGSLTAPIFQAGAIAGQIQVAEAQQQQALYQYRKVIQTAFREVEDALVDQQRTREQLAIQARQGAALADYARIARLRYDNGYTSYIEVLDSERSLFSAELSQTQTQNNLFQSMVSLYKAMGGGWVNDAEMIAGY
jgi:multidrug efflux system outer membrane protein